MQASPPDMTGWRVHLPGGDGGIDTVQPDRYAPGDWRAWVTLDEPGSDGRQDQVYALWDLVVLSDGAAERAALLAEMGM